MRKYIIDQVVFLILGILILFCIPYVWGRINVVVLFTEVIGVLSWGYVCRRIILLPFDLIKGKRTIIATFWGQCYIQKYEFYHKKYYPIWKFRSNEKKYCLAVPVAMNEEELSNMIKPEQGKKVKITYYCFSKILLYCEVMG